MNNVESYVFFEIIISFIFAFFIFFVVKNIIQSLAEKYFKLNYEEVKPQLQSAQASFFVNYVTIFEVEDSLLSKCFNGFKTFHSSFPFLFKLYLFPDCIILTFLNKYAEIFKKNKCTFSKKNFFSYFSIIKDDKQYTMEVGLKHKLIKEWIGNN